MRLLLLSFLIVLTACKDSRADSDAGLYDPVAPAGSSFVRFLNLEDQSVVPKIGKKKYKALDQGQVSAYFPVPEGSVTIRFAGKELPSDLVAGDFYTAINGGAPFLIKDDANLNRSKVTIAFYNLSDIKILSLKVRGGSVEVLKDVQSNKMSAREMNAVKIDFSIFDGETNLISLDETVLERGNHYSIIYDGKTVQMVTATTNTRK